MLIAFAAGVERIYWYSFRSTEWDQGCEAHFGIIRNHLEPKPGYLAYQMLTRMYPAGSKNLAIRRDGEVYFANWQKPDGTNVHAVWAPNEDTRVVCSGDFAIAGGLLGASAVSRKLPNGLTELTATPAIVYLTGSPQFCSLE